MARALAKNHEEKRLSILKTAANLFAETGYDRAAMSRLAVECGVSKSLIYHYYSNKEALLFDIIATHLNDVLTAVQAVPRQASTSPELHLVNLCRALLKSYDGADKEHRLQLEAMRFLPDDQQRQLHEKQRDLVQVFASAIQNAAPHSFAQDASDLRAVTMTLFGMLNWFFLWFQPGKGLSRDGYGEMAADMVLGGVARRAR
jgi:AcrR family transcriptional regulator